uniref:Glutathione peroxidase n=1 Tax=Picea sitchensis TaxID=3332 RepID=A9NQB1_PICSI|nr:unknown [Picea sitchensis]ABK23541.1 unknown [Picea sitchensis]
MQPCISSRLPRSFPAVPILQALLYKPLTPSIIPRAFHFRASPSTKISSRFCSWIKPRVPPQDFVIFRVGFSANFTAMTGSSSKQSTSVYDFTVKDIRGNDVDLSIYKGKVLLIVNVASQCGLTNSNYNELNEVYTKYKDQGLEILAFPCNQFGEQEPGDNAQIAEVACTRFKAEFPIFDKVEVNGSNAAPIYKFLKSSKGGLLGNGIKWNFTKFLVDKDGNVVERYAPTTSPLSIEKNVKKLLGIA